MTLSIEPRLGQRVRFTTQHDRVPIGSSGMIDQVSGDQFVVLLDEGAWFFWTTFAKWEPTGEPDVELSAEYKAARTLVDADLSEDDASTRLAEYRREERRA